MILLWVISCWLGSTLLLFLFSSPSSRISMLLGRKVFFFVNCGGPTDPIKLRLASHELFFPLPPTPIREWKTTSRYETNLLSPLKLNYNPLSIHIHTLLGSQVLVVGILLKIQTCVCFHNSFLPFPQCSDAKINFASFSQKFLWRQSQNKNKKDTIYVIMRSLLFWIPQN